MQKGKSVTSQVSPFAWQGSCCLAVKQVELCKCIPGKPGDRASKDAIPTVGGAVASMVNREGPSPENLQAYRATRASDKLPNRVMISMGATPMRKKPSGRGAAPATFCWALGTNPGSITRRRGGTRIVKPRGGSTGNHTRVLRSHGVQRTFENMRGRHKRQPRSWAPLRVRKMPKCGCCAPRPLQVSGKCSSGTCARLKAQCAQQARATHQRLGRSDQPRL